MAYIELVGLSKQYGTTPAVAGLSAALERGECLSLLGPSGSGKSTVLRLVAGLAAPDAGSVLLEDLAIEHLPAHKRNIGLVLPSHPLFPHLTAAGNVAFGLRLRTMRRSTIRTKVSAALQAVGLGTLGDRYPRELSPVQQQRVAVARAIVVEPDALLLDEPFMEFDLAERMELRNDVRQLQKRLGLTTILATRNQQDALSVSDQVLVMKNGRAVETGKPRDLADNPSSSFTADFLGNRTVLPGHVVTDGRYRLFEADCGIRVPLPPGVTTAPSHLVLRATRLALQEDVTPPKGSIFSALVRVADSVFLGDSVATTVEIGDRRITVMRGSTMPPLESGKTVLLAGGRASVAWLNDTAA